jgi:hypothetical protein
MSLNQSAAALLVSIASLHLAAGFQSPQGRSPIPVIIQPKVIYAPEASTPRLATLARLHGAVEFRAEIDEAGTVASLHAIAGHPLLIPAALQAAQRYRYAPGTANGEPIRFVTTIMVVFQNQIAPVELVPIN